MARSDDNPRDTSGPHGHRVCGAESPRGRHQTASEPGPLLAGRYRLGRRIGHSALGELVRAEDLERGRPVAVRLVPPELSGGDDLLARLELRRTRNARLPRGEVPLLADLIDLLDLGHDERGRLFLVTDPFPAESLADLLVRAGPPPWQRVRALMVRACQIVHLSHEHGIIRQDLQPGSLYPVRDKFDPGTLKVVSPGLLVASGGRVWSLGEPQAALALARYAAPEQISAGVVDRRTDVYALGLILYECLTGRVPFADPRPAHVLAAHLITPPPPFPADVRRRVPAELEAIVARALAKSPDDRWPTVMALANALAAIEFGRCDLSGVLETDDRDLLEPPPSSTSMRVDAARLSGRAGLGPVVDPSATGEHAVRELLGAAESTGGRPAVAADSSASLSRTSESARAHALSIHDSAPTLPLGRACDSTVRWEPPPRPAPSLRRVAPWLLAAALSVVTAGVVSVAVRRAATPAAPPDPAPAAAPAGLSPQSEPVPAASRPPQRAPAPEGLPPAGPPVLADT